MNQANLELAKKLNRIAIVLSVIVIIVAASMHKIHIETSIDFSFLPKVYSTMNALAAVALIMALIFIKQGKIDLHKKSMTIALGMSILFLAMYVLYHLTNPHTLFCREGVIRYVYFFLLASHIILAAVILPFILFTFIRGYTMQVEKHKKMARWVYPLWLYVAVTGPILYFMLSPCYK